MAAGVDGLRELSTPHISTIYMGPRELGSAGPAAAFGGGGRGESRPRDAPPNSAIASGRLAVVIADFPVGLSCEHQRNRR